MQNTAIMIPVPVVDEWIRPPGRNTRNHMLKQKPPKRQPRPSVTSGNTSEMAPQITLGTKIPTKYPPWRALLTGGFMT